MLFNFQGPRFTLKSDSFVIISPILYVVNTFLENFFYFFSLSVCFRQILPIIGRNILQNQNNIFFDNLFACIFYGVIV